MRNQKKTYLRLRILAAFSSVLFFSFLLISILFNVAIRLFASRDVYYAAADEAATGRAGLVLVPVVAIMFVVAVVVTYFLSNSITRPIEQLSQFALGLGKGNFAANDFAFQDIELENLNAAFNHSVRQLGAYDRVQKDFFQNASHELRTPLMSIKVYAEGIIYGLMEPQKAGETILEETDRLSDLVTDLLYMAKIDNSTTVYKTEAIDLTALIRTCMTRQQAIADKRQIAFIFDAGESTMSYTGIADLLARAVDNLIANALRSPASEITITCRKDDRHITITVADDGGGIAAETLPHVFERFYKGKGGHTGIGLAIVKSIADQHQGRVTAANGTNGGAVFVLSLPMA